MKLMRRKLHIYRTGHDVTETQLYFSYFDDTIKMENEYRVFVFNGNITGISQYRWYRCHENVDIQSLINMSNNIYMFIKNNVLTQLENGVNITIDVMYDWEKSTVYLIEINNFGGHTGCGSALFHWKNDEHILYSNGNCVEFRILI